MCPKINNSLKDAEMIKYKWKAKEGHGVAHRDHIGCKIPQHLQQNK